jgi:hypothetical protein
MAEKKIQEELVEELRAWCGDAVENRGRRAEVARAIGVGRGLVGEWLKGNAYPGLENGLRLQAFLRKQRRRKKAKA